MFLDQSPLLNPPCPKAAIFLLLAMHQQTHALGCIANACGLRLALKLNAIANFHLTQQVFPLARPDP
jgi:hypothetical protein